MPLPNLLWTYICDNPLKVAGGMWLGKNKKIKWKMKERSTKYPLRLLGAKLNQVMYQHNNNNKLFGSECSDWKQVSKTRKEFYNTDKNVPVEWDQDKFGNKLKC